MLVDGNGDVVGPVIGFDLGATKFSSYASVIVSTPNQGQVLLRINFEGLQESHGFEPQGQLEVYFESLECPENDTAYLFPRNAVPNVFLEATIFSDGVLWIGTSFEHQTQRRFFSRLRGDGLCQELQTVGIVCRNCYPAEQLTDEFGALVEDIDDLYPPPLRIEAQ